MEGWFINGTLPSKSYKSFVNLNICNIIRHYYFGIFRKCLFMRKHLLFFSFVILFFSSCSKTYEDRLIGQWRLNESYRQRLFDKDHFQTGYESGVFTLNENGTAVYTSTTDTLKGYWNADRYNNYRNGDNQSYKHLQLNLINFNQNKFINWSFDDFSFRNDFDRIKAIQFSLSSDIIYEFVRNK